MISTYIFLLIHFCFTLLFHCAPTHSSTSHSHSHPHPLTHMYMHTHTHTIKPRNNKLNNAFEKNRKTTNWTNVSLIFNTATFAMYFPTVFFFYFNPLPLSLCLYIFEKLNQMLYFCALNIHNIRFICLFVCLFVLLLKHLNQLSKPNLIPPVPYPPTNLSRYSIRFLNTLQTV